MARRTLEKECRSFKFLVLNVLRLKIFGTGVDQIMKQPIKVVDEQCEHAVQFWSDMSLATEQIRTIVEEIEGLHKTFKFNSRQNAAQSEEFSEAVRKMYAPDSRPALSVVGRSTPRRADEVVISSDPARGEQQAELEGRDATPDLRDLAQGQLTGVVLRSRPRFWRG